MNRVKLLLPLFAAAAGVGWFFDQLQVPVGWLLGPMLTGMIAAGIKKRPLPINPLFVTAGQGLLGLYTGIGFPLATLLLAAKHAIPLLAAVLLTGGLSLLNGYLLSKWAGVDRATGFLGTLPGAASSMVAMSEEMGADSVAVAILQYWRLLLVVFLAPPLVHWLFPSVEGAAVATTALGALPGAPLLLNLAVLIACGLAGAWVGKLAHLPSPNFLGAFLLSLLVSWVAPYSFHLPTFALRAGLLLLGLSIGLRFDLPMAKKLGKATLVETLLVLALIGASLGVGYGFHLLTGIDTLTAVLGSTPGGMEVMIASAAQLGGDTGLVLAMQMTRWFVILLAGPWVTQRLVRRRVEAKMST